MKTVRKVSERTCVYALRSGVTEPRDVDSHASGTPQAGSCM